jgi:hypothetical protein
MEDLLNNITDRLYAMCKEQQIPLPDSMSIADREEDEEKPLLYFQWDSAAVYIYENCYEYITPSCDTEVITGTTIEHKINKVCELAKRDDVKTCHVLSSRYPIK